MPKREEGKPKGRMSAYAYFVQMCREEHKKKHPNENVVFTEFSKKCAERWKLMTPEEKKRFETMSEKDKVRYQSEMADYVPPPTADGKPAKRQKRKKDPNAPKRAMSAFFHFCNEVRPTVKAEHPEWTVGDMAKDMGKKWEKVTDRSKYEKAVEKDKLRYAAEMADYNAAGGASTSAAVKQAKVAAAAAAADDDDEEDEESD